LTDREHTFLYNDGSGSSFIIPEGAYMCKTPAFTEYIIGLLCSRLYQIGKSINFIEMNGLTTCMDTKRDKQTSSQYIFMEKITGQISSLLEKSPSKIDLDSLIIQLLFGIKSYQLEYNICHNDLHTGNIMYLRINEHTEYQGEKLFGADYYHYEWKGKNIYFPATLNIVKIADFGLSVKHSEPIVGPEGMLQGYDKYSPNWYNTYFDVIFSMTTIMKTLYLHGGDFSDFSVFCYFMVIYPIMLKSQLDGYRELNTHYDRVSHLLNIYVENSISETKRLRPDVCMKAQMKKINIYGSIFNEKQVHESVEEYLQEPPKDARVVTLGRI
jgi:serine/threonine protein kinase